MKRFELCIPRILKHEGGFVNHPRDPGGATNKGITIATYRRYINRNGTVADLKALTTAQAVKVYKAQYWDKVRGDELPVGVDYTVADFAVNSGPSRAIKHLQRAVGVRQDGAFGPATMAAVRQVRPVDIIRRIHDSRMAFLRGLKTWPTFKKGWTSRVSDVLSDSIADAGAAPLRPVQPQPAPKVPQSTQTPASGPAGRVAVGGGLVAAVVGTTYAGWDKVEAFFQSIAAQIAALFGG